MQSSMQRIPLRAKSGYAVGSNCWSQLQTRNAQGHIDGNRTLNGDGLQSHCTSRTTDQNVGASTETDPNVARGSDIFASKCARWNADRRRKHSPREYASGADSDVNANCVERPLVGLWRIRGIARDVTTLHGLMPRYDKPMLGLSLHVSMPAWVHLPGACAKACVDSPAYNEITASSAIQLKLCLIL